MKCYLDGKSLRENDQQLDLVRSKSAGLMAQCTAIFIPTHDVAEQCAVSQTPNEYFLSCYDIFLREMKANNDLGSVVSRFSDIEDNFNQGKISAILTIEDGVLVAGRLNRLLELYELGVRLITLTWNYENCFGFPHSLDQDAMSLGLKPFGIEAVQYMNELGIVIDVSHLSEGGFDDVAVHSKKPFTASHSCCRALCDVSRNLTDRQLRLLGEHGGVCGVNFAPAFLEKDAEYASTDSVVKHIQHIVSVAGIEAAAFGSDFDGFPGEVEFRDCLGMPQLIQALSKVFTPREIDKICYENTLRLFRENFC